MARRRQPIGRSRFDRLEDLAQRLEQSVRDLLASQREADAEREQTRQDVEQLQRQTQTPSRGAPTPTTTGRAPQGRSARERFGIGTQSEPGLLGRLRNRGANLLSGFRGAGPLAALAIAERFSNRLGNLSADFEKPGGDDSALSRLRERAENRVVDVASAVESFFANLTPGTAPAVIRQMIENTVNQAVARVGELNDQSLSQNLSDPAFQQLAAATASNQFRKTDEYKRLQRKAERAAQGR